MLGPMQVFGRLVMVATEHRVGNLMVGTTCLLALALAAVFLAASGLSLVLLAVFVLLQGAGNGVNSIIRPVLIADFLGRRNFGLVSGMIAIPFVGGSALGPTLGSIIWVRGGYDSVLVAAFAISLFGLVMLRFASVLARR